MIIDHLHLSKFTMDDRTNSNVSVIDVSSLGTPSPKGSDTSASSTSGSNAVIDGDFVVVPPQVFSSKRKRMKLDFPWSYTHPWVEGDPIKSRNKIQCILCKKWFSPATNASGWKAHLHSQHSITAAGGAEKCTGMQLSIEKKATYSPQTTTKFENAIIDFVIGGGISLAAAGGDDFKDLVHTLTNGYASPSTRTIIRRIEELFFIAKPLLADFFNILDVKFSLTMDGWSNRNIKGFFIVTAHWVDAASGTSKSLLLTILDVQSGKGVGRRAGEALFEHLKAMGKSTISRLLNITTDNGSDAVSAVQWLTNKVNLEVGHEQMDRYSHIRCADHSVQRAIVLFLGQIKPIIEHLRAALIGIRRSKVVRQAYRAAARTSGLPSIEPTHHDCPTRWNSTHQMCLDATEKRLVLDAILQEHHNVVGVGPLTAQEWKNVKVVSDFLVVPRQVMERLGGDHSPTLNLVAMLLRLLVDHVNEQESAVLEVCPTLSFVEMKKSLLKYQKILNQDPAIIANYLNPQTAQPTDPVEKGKVLTLVSKVLNSRYSDLLKKTTVNEAVGVKSLENLLFSQSVSRSANLTEIERYLAIDPVNSCKFLDVVQWWMSRKEIFPAHCQMAIDYLGSPATSTASERVNSTAGREYTTSRQSLSPPVFIKTMCVRSWIKAGVMKVPSDRARSYRDTLKESVHANEVEAKFGRDVERIFNEQSAWQDEEEIDECTAPSINEQFNQVMIDSQSNDDDHDD